MAFNFFSYEKLSLTIRSKIANASPSRLTNSCAVHPRRKHTKTFFSNNVREHVQEIVALPKNKAACILGLQISRREVLTGTAGSVIGTLALNNGAALAEGHPKVTGKAYFDITVDGRELGRIVVGVFGEEAPVGAQRFLDLAQNKQGVGYRRSAFHKLTEDFIQNVGVRELTYGAGETEITGGESAEDLEIEMDKTPLRHTSAGLVSMIVRLESSKSEEPGSKLEFVNGKLVEVAEPPLSRPNGTAWCVTTAAFPDPDFKHRELLDQTNLVVGRVLEGMDIVERLAQEPRVKPNLDSPFFKTAKAIGDSRAIVAEQGFGRPFAKILIKKSGLLN
mmetsp:Transcript_32713/g.45394  ORF Transcript_32713/g.45394 Transcript_32713/m.45394 type:complete len:334 (-) Transcript_32713:285-1286(-)|eukprot:CAMPEP_0196576326 /NCGR_PEP_ID=MMETSP1081-20130531/5619_1 /TAXON_ID=36882 /ORGANISM="Pyramimonas amylifera, Strain CCMP720" /LENGTH=333 /DNA_ID=CAMNT_0041894909 /DNA_START=17 /DNA_END=1018 /DNA_ORIENTATION=-